LSEKPVILPFYFVYLTALTPALNPSRRSRKAAVSGLDFSILKQPLKSSGKSGFRQEISRFVSDSHLGRIFCCRKKPGFPGLRPPRPSGAAVARFAPPPIPCASRDLEFCFVCFGRRTAW
jgi:hypothetical protein